MATGNSNNFITNCVDYGQLELLAISLKEKDKKIKGGEEKEKEKGGKEDSIGNKALEGQLYRVLCSFFFLRLSHVKSGLYACVDSLPLCLSSTRLVVFQFSRSVPFDFLIPIQK